MKIVVCVKFCPDAAAERCFAADNTTERVEVDGVLSELDEYAVEQALTIAEAGDAEVVALTVGPKDASEAVRKSLQMGADRGVHVVDDAIHGSDALATSLVLAKAVEKIGDVDLVLTGMSSTDAAMGVVPTMLAAHVRLPAVTYASALTLEGDRLSVVRDGDASSQTIVATLPAVVSVTDHINEPRYPSFKGIMTAKKKPVDTYSLADLGIDAGEVGLAAARTAVEEISARPPRQAGDVVTDDGDGGAKLAAFLKAHKFA